MGTIVKHDPEAAKRLGERYNRAAIARGLFDALKDIDERSVNQVFTRASEVAFNLIGKGMDSNDRVNFRHLLASGLPTGSRNANTDTLLIAACKSRDADAIATLLRFNADPKAADDQGHDAAYWAELSGSKALLENGIKEAAMPRASEPE